MEHFRLEHSPDRLILCDHLDCEEIVCLARTVARHSALRRRFQQALNSATRHDTSDKLAMHGMHNGLKPVMCSQLVVDVVEMVAECL